MSFKRYLGYKAVKLVGSVLMIFSLFLIFSGMIDPSSPWGPRRTNYAQIIGGILLFPIGWVVYQYGTFKEIGEQIAIGVKKGIKSEGEPHIRNLEKTETGPIPNSQEVIFDGYIEINGKEYECYSLKIEEIKQVIFRIKVEGERNLNFYIINDRTFQKWKKGEPILDAYISKIKISYEDIKWIPTHPGEYYILFDNTYSSVKKRCKVQIILREIVE